MARERYLVDTSEDTIHSNEIVLTEKKEIYKNWWYYHKGIIAVVLAVVAFVSYMIYSVATKVSPDYQVAILTAVNLPEDIVIEMQDYLENYGEDLNGDGKVVVQINSYVIGDPNGDNPVSPETLQASMVRFMADAGDCSSLVFIHDEETFNHITANGFDSVWRYNDGTKMNEGDTDYENAMYAWEESGAFANFVPEVEGFTEENVKMLFSRYRVSFRKQNDIIEKSEKKIEYYKKSEEFFQRILDNNPVNTEKD